MHLYLDGTATSALLLPALFLVMRAALYLQPSNDQTLLCAKGHAVHQFCCMFFVQ